MARFLLSARIAITGWAIFTFAKRMFFIFDRHGHLCQIDYMNERMEQAEAKARECMKALRESGKKSELVRIARRLEAGKEVSCRDRDWFGYWVPAGFNSASIVMALDRGYVI